MASHAQLAIDLEGIQNWGNALNNVRAGLDRPVEFSSCDDQLGTDPASTAVQNALMDFDRAWKDGRTVLDSSMSALSKMCDDTVARIRQLDHSLVPPAPHRRPDI